MRVKATKRVMGHMKNCRIELYPAVRTNIQKSLATQISQITLDLRKQQKNLYQKIKALDAGTDVGLIDTNQEYADVTSEKVVYS